MWRWFTLLLACLVLTPIASNALQREADEPLRPAQVRSTWGKKLNPGGAVPARGFKAIYFDRQNPSQVVFQENVESIAIKYAWADFHRIDSPRFAGYWVGRMNFRQSARKQISVSQSWAKTRILIDGEIVFDGGESKAFAQDFSAGEHVIEVEYINNWHTTEFKVTIEDEVTTWSERELRGYFQTEVDPNARLYYAGVYESAAKDTSITVSLPRTGRPIILWLGSYEAIDWNVAPGDEIAAVVVSSFSPGSRVRGTRARVIHTAERQVAAYRESEGCSCHSGHFHCESGQHLNDLAEKLQAVTELKLAGYDMRYSAAALTMKPYDAGTRRAIEERTAANLRLKDQCTRNANPDFDKLMEQ